MAWLELFEDAAADAAGAPQDNWDWTPTNAGWTYVPFISASLGTRPQTSKTSTAKVQGNRGLRGSIPYHDFAIGNFGGAAGSPSSSAGNGFLRSYMCVGSPGNPYYIDIDGSLTDFGGGYVFLSWTVTVSPDGSVSVLWDSNDDGVLDNGVTSAPGTVIQGQKFRYEAKTEPNGNVTIRIFKGAALHADHSNPSYYTEITGGKCVLNPSAYFYAPGGNRVIGAYRHAAYPAAAFDAAGGLSDSGMDALDFGTTDWLGPYGTPINPAPEVAYWGVAS